MLCTLLEIAQPQQEAATTSTPVKKAILDDVDHLKAKYLEFYPQYEEFYQEAATVDYRHWIPRRPLTPEEEFLVTGNSVEVEKWHSLRRDGNYWRGYEKWE